MNIFVKVKELEEELIDIKEKFNILEKNLYPIKDFVTCNCCKRKLKEKKEK